jgi:endonuclease YncB( thermonuclease family)
MVALWRDGVLAMRGTAALAMIGLVAALDGVAAQPVPPCGGTVIERGILERATDGRTFTLDDGTEVRLAGIEVPVPAESSAAATAARDGLASLLADGEIVLRQAEAQKTDRYRRLFAYAGIVRDGPELPVQTDLVAHGLARVADRVGGLGCAAELLRQESAARAAKLGLWAAPYYAPFDAGNPVAIMAARGRFVLVEGRVLSVRESGATIYVNFGQRWTEDFTVTILKRNARSFVGTGIEPVRLAGRRLRVRGWVEGRSGPVVEASRPEQIEIIDRE